MSRIRPRERRTGPGEWRPRMRDLAAAGGALTLAIAAPLLPAGETWTQVARAMLLLFWIAAAVRAGRAAALAIAPDTNRVRRVLRTFLWGYLYVLTTGVTASALGLLDVVPLTVVHALVFVGLRRRGSGAGEPAPTPEQLLAAMRRRPLTALLVALLLGLAVYNAGWALISPIGHRDDFSYHLVFPVEWSQTGTLGYKTIPFSNHAATYHPKNTEAVYVWTLLPAGGVRQVVAFQLLLVTMLAVALYDTFRRCGAAREGALTAALVATASPVLVEHLNRGYVDIAFSLFFVLCVNRILALRETPGRAGWIELCIAAGVFAGTKAAASLFSAVLLLPFALFLLGPRLVRRPGFGMRLVSGAVSGAAVYLLAGGWWYLRNWAVTGNPFFPAIVRPFGVDLFDGAYRVEAFTSGDWTELAYLYLPSVLVVIAAGAVLTLVVIASGGRGRALFLCGVLLPAGIVAVFVWMLPIGYPRFALAGSVLSAGALVVPLGLAAPVRRAFEAALIGALLLELAYPLGLRGPIFDSHLLVDATSVAVLILALCGLLLILSLAGMRHTPRSLRTGTVAGAMLLVTTLVLGDSLSGPRGTHLSDELAGRQEPWNWIADRYGAVTLALTGTQEAFRQYGPELANRVLYVNVNPSDDWLFHDYVRAHPEDRARLEYDLGGVGYYRRDPSFEAWLANLRRRDVRLVATLRLPIRRKRLIGGAANKRHPIEREWLLEHPETFRSVYEADGVEIYELRGS